MNDSNSATGISPKHVAASLLAVALIAGAIWALSLLRDLDTQPLPEELAEYLMWDPVPMTEFTLVDFNGSEIGLEQLKGRWTFVFFGYTFCPDVCPTTLANLAAVFRLLEPEFPVSDVQVIFISVDPERDTPSRLKQYVPHFDSRFVGAVGTRDQLDAFTRQLGAMYFIDAEDRTENYLVSHNSSLFLIDPGARQFARFTVPHVPQEIASAFIEIAHHYHSQQRYLWL